LSLHQIFFDLWYRDENYSEQVKITKTKTKDLFTRDYYFVTCGVKVSVFVILRVYLDFLYINIWNINVGWNYNSFHDEIRFYVQAVVL
jgi:hypothetical protein